jgi:hypothetical protein
VEVVQHSQFRSPHGQELQSCKKTNTKVLRQDQCGQHSNGEQRREALRSLVRSESPVSFFNADAPREELSQYANSLDAHSRLLPKLDQDVVAACLDANMRTGKTTENGPGNSNSAPRANSKSETASKQDQQQER